MNRDSTDAQQSPPGRQDNAVPTDAEAPQKVKRHRARREERKRAARACDQCRRLKEKCEGGIPCRRCTHFRRSCEFQGIASQGHDFRLHLGRPPISDATARELIERSMYMERILKHRIDGIALDTKSLHRMAEAIVEEGTDDDHPVGSSPNEEDGLAIEEEVCTIDPVEATTTHYSGEFSHWNFSMRIKRHIEDQMTGSMTQRGQGLDQVSDYWRAQQLNSGSNNLSTAFSCCPPRHIADFLVRIFFKYAETYQFYVEKSWLLDKLNILYNDPENFGIKGAGVISIILTVLAIGTQYAYLESPNQKATGKSGSRFSEDELGTMFYQHAIRLLPEIIEASSLESVQACLLFAVYSLPIDASGLGYVYVNLAMRLAVQNGMHRNYTGNAFSPVMIETRNRVWWSAYTLERKISIFHGRPLSTLRSDVDSDLPKDRGDMQREDFAPNVAFMVASIHLTHRLEDYFNEISLLRTCQKQEIPDVLSRLLAIKNELASWWGSLPEEVLTDKLQHQAQFRSVMHLRLEYCLIRMFVGRPFLFNRHSSRSNPNSPESCENKSPADGSIDRTAIGSQTRVSCRAGLVNDCIQAAKEALEICRPLRDSGPGLARASYIEYSSCRASLLVLIAYSIQNQSDEFRKHLRDGLDMIREMSAAGDSARSEVSLIEALERALARLHHFSAKHSRDNNANSAPDSLAADYDRFKHWESMWKSGGTVTASESGSRPMAGHVAVSTSTPAQPQAVGHNSHAWSMGSLTPGEGDDSYAVSSSNTNVNTLRPLNSPAELAFFRGGNIPLSSRFPTHPETQALEEFLAIPEYRFDSGVGVENGLGLMGSAPGVTFEEKMFW